MSAVLITGGLGFLGVHLARHFKTSGVAEPVVLDISPDTPAMLPSHTRIYRVDVRDRESLAQVLRRENPKFIIHAAAQLPRAPEQEIVTTTVDGTRNVIELAQEVGVERVLFTSSTAVYKQSSHPISHDETSEREGLGPYGRAKVEAEDLCARARERGQCVIVVRPRSFLGPGRMGIFQLLFQWIAEGRHIPMIGSGRNRTQLLDVDDLCSAIELLLTSDVEKTNGTFNVGAETYSTVREDLEAVCRHAGTGARPFGTPARLVQKTLSVLHRARLAPIYPWVIETASLDSEVRLDRIKSLGWHAKYSNAELLSRAFDSYQQSSSVVSTGPETGHLAKWDPGLLGLLRHLF